LRNKLTGTGNAYKQHVSVFISCLRCIGKFIDSELSCMYIRVIFGNLVLEHPRPEICVINWWDYQLVGLSTGGIINCLLTKHTLSYTRAIMFDVIQIPYW